jgi:hypothetical protein
LISTLPTHLVREGRVAEGRGWIGLADRNAYQLRNIRRVDLAPGWLTLLLAAGLAFIGWHGGTRLRFARFGEPRTQSAQPGLVRKRYPVCSVRMPWPKCELASRPALAWSSAERIRIASWAASPRQVASKSTGAKISQPLALAIDNGRQP